MYRRYYSYNDMPVPIVGNKSKPVQIQQEKKEIKQIAEKNMPKKNSQLSFLENLKSDDLILIAVVFLLLIDDCDDVFLLLALAFVFISGQK